MSPTSHRAVALTLLFISTASFGQGTAAGTSASGANAQPGVFRPIQAGSDSGAAAVSGQHQPVPVMSIGKEYRVGTNDLLDIEVLNLENGKRTVRVNAAGAITLPLIGSVTVAGLTQQQVESHIGALYGEKYLQNPQVSVFIKEFTTERITVDGAISKPGIYPLVGQMTLLRVIALAGGFGQIAKPDKVMLFRNGENGVREVATFDVTRIRAGTDPDPIIRGDDLIVVQRDPTRALLKDSLFKDIIDTVNPLNYIR